MEQARMEFKSGWGISVIRGDAAFGSITHPYEAVLTREGQIYFSEEHPYSDVQGYQDEEGVTKIMREIQKFPPIKML